MPWEQYDVGLFHIKDASATVNLTGGPFTAWDVDGTNERQITSIAAGEELVFITSKEQENLFRDNVSNWEFGDITNTQKVTTTYGWFRNCSNFTGDVSKFDMRNVTDMQRMFFQAYQFDSDISGWIVSKVTKFDLAFHSCAKFNSDISSWNTVKAESLSATFFGCSIFDQDLSLWCVINIPSDQNTFAGTPIESQPWKYPVWGTCPRGENRPS